MENIMSSVFGFERASSQDLIDLVIMSRVNYDVGLRGTREFEEITQKLGDWLNITGSLGIDEDYLSQNRLTYYRQR